MKHHRLAAGALALVSLTAIGRSVPAAPERNLPHSAGSYQGHEWFVDENHLLWWDGRPYVPFGGFGIQPGNEFGLETHNLWIDFDPFISKPGYTRKEHQRDIARRLQAITGAGGTCIVQFSMARPHLPDGPQPGMRWKEPEGGVDASRLEDPEVKRAILKVWAEYAPAVRQECVRGIVLWNEINVWRWPERLSVEEYGKVLGEYAREVKRLVGDLPVCFKIAGTWRAQAVIAGAAAADGLGLDVWFTGGGDERARREVERSLRLLERRARKTTWFFIAEGGRVVPEEVRVAEYWDRWPPFRSREEARGILEAYARLGAKGFIYNGPRSEPGSTYRESYRWLGELQLEVRELMVSTKRLPPEQRGMTAERAIAAARGDGKVKDLLEPYEDVRAEAEFSWRWDVWLVHFLSGDRRVAFASVNEEGEVLEVGRGHEDEEGEAHDDDFTGTLPAPPFVINCGPRSDDDGAWERGRGDRDGIPVLPDRRRTERSAHGFEAGEPFRHWFSLVWGRPERYLFTSGRVHPESYSFQLPRGEYVLSLGFCEGEHHTAERRVFDVLAQGERLFEGLDPFAVAGYNQAFRLSRRVKVRGDEGLTVVLRPRQGEPLVNAVWVYPYERGDEPPREPPGFRGSGSYGMNFLYWNHPEDESVAGYVIERQAPGEKDFERLSPRPVPVARWVDREVEPGGEYGYRLACVDVDGRRGRYSKVVTLEPRSTDDSSLPVYSIEASEGGLTYMRGNVTEDRTVGGTIAIKGKRYPMEFRIRGAVTRFAAKKSYRIRFLGESPFGSRDVIYLKAGPQDPTLLQEKLTCDVFSAAGLPVSEAAFVQLVINGRYQGVYVDIEPIRAPFKERAGLDAAGTLLRARTFQQLGEQVPGDLRGVSGSVAHLTQFIRRMNRVDRGELESFVRGATEWGRLRDYLVASVLCHRSEIEANDYFYYRDSRTLRWFLLPWDHNNGNFGISGPADGPGRPFIPLFGQTIQGIGHQHRYWYLLPSRILHNPTLRGEYLERLAGLTRDLLLSGKVGALIDKNHRTLRDEAIVDPYRWPPGQDEPFLRAADELKRFVRRHGNRLLRLIAEERGREAAPVVISEFQFGAGEGWVELHNRSSTPVSLAGYALGDFEKRGAPYRLRDNEKLQPGGFKVYTIAYRPPARTRSDDRRGDTDELEPEELERREREALARRRRFSGFDPHGGTIGFFAPESDSEDDDRSDSDDRDRGSRLLDWYFYGRQSSRYSYGRAGDRYGFMKPTPGRENDRLTLSPPPLLADGGVVWKDHRPQQVTALVTDLCGGEPPQEVTLHYRIAGTWRRKMMTLEQGGGAEPERRVLRRATATLEIDEPVADIRYYFVARARNGLERHGPLTAPEDTYGGGPSTGSR